MSTVAPLAPTVAPPRPTPDAFAVVRALLLVAVTIGAVLLPVVGQRQTGLDTLVSEVAQGRVTTVEQVGMPTGSFTGTATVELRWRLGSERWFADVRVERHEDADQVARVRTSSAYGSSSYDYAGTPADLLNDAAPGPLTLRDGGEQESGFWTTMPLGWRIHGLVGWLYLGIGLVFLSVLVAGPPPWRATRWAWFWLLLDPLSVLTIPAYCLLAGPTRGIPAPQAALVGLDGTAAERRLTGGWAFVLALVASHVLKALLS